MKRLLVLAFCFVFASISYSNKKITIQDLEQAVLNAKSNEQKIVAQNKLAEAHLLAGDWKTAQTVVDENYDFAKSIPSCNGISNCLLVQGKIFESKFDYSNALKNYQAALDEAKKGKNNILVSTSENRIGQVLLLQGETEEAINLFKTSLKNRNGANYKSINAETFQLLGDAYLSLNNKRPGSAVKEYQKALQSRIELEELSVASDIASKIGKIESDLGAYDSALTYFQNSLDLNSSTENLPKIAQDYENIANTYFAQSATDEAIEANSVALQIWTDLGDKMAIANTQKNAAIFYAALDDNEKAKGYLEQSTKMMKGLAMTPSTYLVYQDIAKTYEKLGEFKQAYQYQNASAASKEAFFSQEKSKTILELTTKYESKSEAARKQQMIERLEMEQASSRKVRTFLMALIGLIGALAMTLYYSYRQKKKDNVALQARNTKIQQQKFEIDAKNIELQEKNDRLDVLNSKLIDEMAERESMEQSSFARDRFLASMSHEMRTPMNAIVGLSHLLLEDNPKEDQVDHLTNLLFSANNMTVFINDILDFSKIEAGKLTLDTRQFKPKTLFDQIWRRFKTPIENKGLGVKYEFDERIPDSLIGDPTRMNQIINNLLSTSLQKTDKGSISLKVYLDEFNTKEVMLKILVTDTGNGLSATDIDKMFQNYWEQGNDIYDGYERSRMGLAMAKRLVDLQNGKIDVDTIEGRGTSYAILIPCKVAENTVQAKPVSVPDITEKKTFDNLSILVVEDNKINQLVVAKLLSNLGATVQTVDNGQEAIDIIEEQDFNLILMDIQMPIMDGYKATSIIRSMKDPVKANIPIIALTASAFLSETEKAKLFGMNDHVGKPFGREDLLEKIQSCIESLRPHSAAK